MMRASQWLLSALGIQQHLQSLRSDENQACGHTRVAIIGAGVAASSVTAGLLTKDKSLQITVFEKGSAVGGRMLSTPHPLGYWGAIEHGAAYIAEDDFCSLDLVHRAGLKHGAEVPGSGLGYGRGFPVRTGDTTSALCSLDTSEWRHVRDLFWKYGFSFWRARKLVRNTSLAWLTYNTSQNPLAAFTDPDLLTPASEYFSRKHINGDLVHDILGSCTKARTYQRSTETTALSSLLATRYIERTGVVHGNQQVIQRVLGQSGIDLSLNTTVLRVEAGASRPYTLRYQVRQEETPRESEFDIVIITSPLGTSGMQFDLPEKDLILAASIPYESRHVTYVSTYQPVSHSSKYDYLDITQLSDNVLTSGQPQGVDIDSIDVRMKCGLHKCAPGDALSCDNCGFENIYRIVSRKELKDWDVADLFEPVVGTDRFEGRDVNITTALWDSGISFIHRYAWPQALLKWKEGNNAPHDVELAPGVFYTAAFEHIVSSTEMSCRTGQYVARRVLDMLAEVADKDEL